MCALSSKFNMISIEHNKIDKLQPILINYNINEKIIVFNIAVKIQIA